MERPLQCCRSQGEHNGTAACQSSRNIVLTDSEWQAEMRSAAVDFLRFVGRGYLRCAHLAFLFPSVPRLFRPILPNYPRCSPDCPKEGQGSR